MTAHIAIDSNDASQLAVSEPAGARPAAVELGFPIRGLSFQSRIAVVALLTAVAVLLAACMLFMLQQWRTERAHFLQAQRTLAYISAADIRLVHDRGVSHFQRDRETQLDGGRAQIVRSGGRLRPRPGGCFVTVDGDLGGHRRPWAECALNPAIGPIS